MDDLPWNEFLKSVGAAEEQAGMAAAAPPSTTPAISELTVPAPSEDMVAQATRALGQTLRAVAQPVPASKYDTFSRLGARPGVPFDAQSGLSFVSRLASEREPSIEEQVIALQSEFGKDNVRLNDFGQPVVTTTGPDGKTKDVLVNPLGADAGDLATVMAQAPELAGSVIPLLLTRGATLGPGVLRALGTLGLTVGGEQTAGGLKDIYRRWVEGRNPDVKEVATRRAWSGTTGLITGGALGLAGKAAATLISPFSVPGRLSFRAVDAEKYFIEKYGFSPELTAAERTGSPLLAAGEAMQRRVPGSRTAFQKFRLRQMDDLADLRAIATGEIPDEEAAARRIIDSLKREVAPLEYDVELAAQEAQKAAQSAIVNVIGTPVDKTVIGKAVIAGAKARKAGFDTVNEVNYNAFYGNPKATERVIGGAPLKKAVDDLIETLPAIEKDVQVPTGLVDASNRPIFRTATQEIPVDTPVRSRLEEISRKLEGGKLSINDLKQIRTDVDNAIKTGEAVPGVKEGRLKRYYAALTDAIDNGLAEINDPALTAAWTKATDYYKKNVGRFEQVGIADLFRDPINAPGPTEVVDRALRSSDAYAAYRDFFGKSNPIMQGVHQAAKDDVLRLGQLGKTVDGAEFAQRLESLDARNPELLKDAFGAKQAQTLRNEALILRRAQGASIPKDELDAALSNGTLSADRLRDMITAETRRTTAYDNWLVKELSAGTLGPDKIKPTEVVDKFVFRPATQPEHLSELMNVASRDPQTLEDLRRLTFKKVLDNATVVAENGESTLSAIDLGHTLADPQLSKKLQIVLGSESYQDLEQLHNLLAPGQVSLSEFNTAGGLVGGTLINRMLLNGELSAIPSVIKNFVLATVYTSEPVRRLLSNTVLQQEGKALVVNSAIASSAFGRALLGTFTKEESKRVQATLKGYTDRLVYLDPMQARPGSTARQESTGAAEIPWDQFLRNVGAGADTTTTNAPAAAPQP